MTLRRVQVSDFRCVQVAELAFDPKFTLISGSNASGKTSLLEAIYFLGRGRSFRTQRLQALIRVGTVRFLVVGHVVRSSESVTVGVEGSAEGTRARAFGNPLSSLAALAALFPVQVIDPEVHRLIEEGPSRRRRYLDWGVFHVEHDFIGHWQRFQQTLRQRNAALKLHKGKAEVSAWNGEFAKLGMLIDVARRQYTEKLSVVAGNIVQSLLGLKLELEYRSGWPRDVTLEGALDRSWTHDSDMGNTTVGPHRGEMTIRLNGTLVKDRISRGQQKLLAAALLVAQIRLFPVDGEAQPTLLLDDPAAELDDSHLQLLIGEIVSQPVQLVVTSIRPTFVGFGNPGRRYVIERGQLSEG